jgi:site-specific recombinase XerC
MVRGPKHVVKRGKTPVLTTDQARLLLDSIDTSTPVGLRDRAPIGVMTYAFARVGAVVAMRVEDYFANGKRWWVRLHEKGGKRHEMPAHHKLEAFLDKYIRADMAGDEKTPFFRSARGRTCKLTGEPMHRVDVWRMILRRLARYRCFAICSEEQKRQIGIANAALSRSPLGRVAEPGIITGIRFARR